MSMINQLDVTYPLPYPMEINRITTILERNPSAMGQLNRAAQDAYPIAEERLASLLDAFLQHKRNWGTPIEQELYLSMGVTALVDRLLRARPLAFLGRTDQYLLIGGERGGDGRGNFDTLTSSKDGAFSLERLISYDEMQLSALIGISTPTPFINRGDRNNMGRLQRDCVPNGVYIGLVGARFERPERMEYRHILVTRRQNRIDMGYGVDGRGDTANRELLGIWAEYYGIGGHFPTFDEAETDHLERGKQSDYYLLNSETYFHKRVYTARMRCIIKPLLEEACLRGREADKPVYLHMVGLGLGVWAVSDELQANLLIEESLKLVRRVVKRGSITDIDFSWFPESMASRWPRYVDLPNGGRVSIHYSKNAPAQWTDAKRRHLVVATYAWDSNAYPGNEYWLGMLSASGDPAAMACSAVAELGNPLVNPRICGRRMKWLGSGDHVSGDPIWLPSELRAISVDDFRIVFSRDTADEAPRDYPLRDYQKRGILDWQRGGNEWHSMFSLDRTGLYYHAHGEIGQCYAAGFRPRTPGCLE